MTDKEKVRVKWPEAYIYLRLGSFRVFTGADNRLIGSGPTAPAPKRVEVRAALFLDGVVVASSDASTYECWSKYKTFDRWLTNWHIEGGKVFVEVE